MKKRVLYIPFILAILPIVMLFSCQSDNNPQQEKGTLTIQAFNSDNIAITNNPEDETETKSYPQATDDYKVTISHILTGEIAYATNYGQIKTSPLAIEQGMYRVSAQNIDAVDATWDAPRYAGINEVTVKAGQTNNVNIECRMSNSKVTVEYTELFQSVFNITSVVVSSDNGGELQFVGNEHRAGYFLPGNLSVTVTATKISDGSERIVTYPVANIDAATWYKIKVNLKLFAHTGFDIIVESDVIQEHNTEIDPLS